MILVLKYIQTMLMSNYAVHFLEYESLSSSPTTRGACKRRHFSSTLCCASLYTTGTIFHRLLIFSSSAMYRRCLNVKNLKGSILTTTSSTSALHLHLPCRYHGSDSHPSSSAETVLIQWKQRDGSVVKTSGSIGSSLLNVAHQHDIDLEGACAGVCACSTCHVILEQNVYDALPDASEDEEDMLGTYLPFIQF